MIPYTASRDQIHHRLDFAVTLSSLASFCVLFDIAFKTSNETEMANVEQRQKMIPIITCEIPFPLVLGVNVFDLDSWGPN